MSSSTKLSNCMKPKPVRPENALQPPPVELAVNPPSKCLHSTLRNIFYVLLISLILLFLGFLVYGLAWLLNGGFSSHFATFKVESLSPRKEHWDLILRVGNPRSQKEHGLNLSYKVTHVYVSLSGETIAMGDIPAFNVLMGKDIVLNATFSSLASYTDDKILHDHDYLALNIVAPVSMVDPTIGPDASYSTLTVTCLHFRGIKSSTTQEIQFQPDRCLVGSYPYGTH